jgi:chromosome partitioning protein
MTLDSLKKYFAGMVFTTVIKETVKFKESSVGGYSILEYAESSDAANAYRQLAQEVLENG